MDERDEFIAKMKHDYLKEMFDMPTLLTLEELLEKYKFLSRRNFQWIAEQQFVGFHLCIFRTGESEWYIEEEAFLEFLEVYKNKFETTDTEEYMEWLESMMFNRR